MAPSRSPPHSPYRCSLAHCSNALYGPRHCSTPAEVLQLHRALGNRAVGQLVQAHLSRHTLGPVAAPAGMTVQPKLIVGPVGDQYEQEADRVAQQVVRQLDAAARPPAGRAVQRQEEDDEERVQIRPAAIQAQPGAGGLALSPDLEAAVHQAGGGGQPLPDEIRRPMEQAFGADFGGVRIHADADSDRLNCSMQAQAFTMGSDLFFRRGAYAPGSRDGQKLVAHELTHVVQQNVGIASAVIQRLPSRRDIERELGVPKGQVVESTKYRPVLEAIDKYNAFVLEKEVS
jgi:hypothetical protein